MSEARYILKTISLSKSDAEKFRKQEIEVATAAVRNLYSEASDAAKKLKELIDLPLRMERTDYVRIGPGHPDWDKADVESEADRILSEDGGGQLFDPLAFRPDEAFEPEPDVDVDDVPEVA